MSTVQRVKFLWDASLTLNPSATHVKNLLKSHLRNTCRSLAGTNTAIPLERFTESQMCQRCSLHWQENNFHIKYKTQGLQIKTNKAKNLIQRLKDEEVGKVQGKLTRKQKNRAKWLLKKAKNVMGIHCEFCQHKTFIALDKSNKFKETKKTIPVNEASISKEEVTKKKSKKTKQKDKTAGLKIPTKKPNVEEVPSVKLNLDANPPSRTKVVAKKPNKDQTSKQLTKKAKGPKKNSTPKAPTKTQKQNSLLQLAALLKSQDNSLTSKNRLESLLK